MNKSVESKSEFANKSEYNLPTPNLNKRPIQDILKDINQEDRKVALAVESEIDSIIQAVYVFMRSWKKGGRIYFAGAGTSGRIGAMEACELPATFGISEDRFQFLLAGGGKALRSPCEEAEDDKDVGRRLVKKRDIRHKDLVIGISASGETPFTLGCMREAINRKAHTIGLVNSPKSTLERIVDIPIVVKVGPEFLRRSTRMKAGTAQKMVLNMLTTCAMIKLGHTYGNLMIDVKANNRKLRKRVEQILLTLTGVSEEVSREVLTQSNYEVKPAILMIKKGYKYSKAKRMLEEDEDLLRKVLGNSN